MFRLITRRSAAASDPELTDWIVADGEDAAADRLGVYAGMFAQRMLEAMEQDFPRTRARLGETEFATQVECYMAQHPSTDPSIRNLGRHFPEFLGGDVLARIEWACVEALDAEDAEPLRRAALEVLAPEAWPALRLRLVTSARLVGDRLVWRRGFDVCERALEPDEQRAIERLASGCTFAEACEAFAASPERIRAALEQWLVDELVTLA
jgi:hypothetical protein